jgi:hypothetical protein
MLTDALALPAVDAFVRHKSYVDSLLHRLRVVAPETPKRASLHKHRRPDPRPIMHRKRLHIKNPTFNSGQIRLLGFCGNTHIAGFHKGIPALYIMGNIDWDRPTRTGWADYFGFLDAYGVNWWSKG